MIHIQLIRFFISFIGIRLKDIKKILQNLTLIKAVILDMDGVLVDSEPYHVQSFKIMMDELKLNYEDSFVHSFIGHSIESNIESINEHYMQGCELNLSEAVAYRDALYLDLIKQADLQPMPGIVKLIETCRMKDISLALASSSIQEQVEVILAKLSSNGWNLNTIFTSIVTGDDVKKRKPSPDIYQKSVLNLNIPAHQCLAIEDSPAGVQSAKSTGLHCIALKSAFIDSNKLKGADLLIDNINEIVKLFE